MRSGMTKTTLTKSLLVPISICVSCALAVLPADAQMTPRAAAAADSWGIMLSERHS